MSEGSISDQDNDSANLFEPNWIFDQKATFSFIQWIVLLFLSFPVPVSIISFSFYIEIRKSNDEEGLFLRTQDVFLHAVYARRSKRFSCAPLIVATALPISTQNTFFSRVVLSGTHFEQVLEILFFCLNQCVIFDRERRPWEPYFFYNNKSSLCRSNIFFSSLFKRANFAPNSRLFGVPWEFFSYSC